MKEYEVGLGFSESEFNVEVHVHKNSRSMRKSVVREYGEHLADGAAFAHCFPDRENPLILDFSLDFMPDDVIVHECVHGAIHLAQWIPEFILAGENEVVPWLSGEMFRAVQSIRDDLIGFQP